MPSILTPVQRRFLRFLLGLALFVLANSAYLFLAGRGTELTVFYQLMLLGHLAGGILLLLTATVFIVWHLGRVRPFLRWPAVSSGVGLALSALLLFASGIFILYEANTRDHYWVFLAHRILAVLAPACYATHRLVSHFRPERRPALRGAAAFVLLLAAMGAIHAVSQPLEARAQPAAGHGTDPFVPFRPANYPDPSSPFAPSSTTTDSGDYFPARIITRDERGDFERIRRDVERLGFAADTTIGAETCRRCHPDTVAQWEASAHRFASFNNPFYRAAVERVRETVGRKPSQFCAGCHDPAIMFAGNMTNEIDPLTPESQAGLTCLACHAIERIHGLTGNGNYHVADEKPSPYLGDTASSGLPRFIADQMTKSKPTAHRRMFKKPFFESAEYCATCHKVSLDVPINEYRYLRAQDEYDNWHDSGVSMNAARTFYLPREAKSCRDCHMPPEDAPLGDVSARNGKVRSHRFLAVNTALPYLRGDFDHLRRTESFVRGKLDVDVFALQYADGAMVRAVAPAQPPVVPGEEVVFEVVVRNRGVGHTFPGGTNDSNEAWIDFFVTDEDGNELFRSGAVGEDGHLDRSAHFYGVVMVRHDGTEADERDAQTFHVAAFQRVINPGTADVARYAFTLPRGFREERIRVGAALRWRKFKRKYTEFVFGRPGIKVPDLPHLEGQRIPELPITTIAEQVIHLPVRGRRGSVRPVTDPERWEAFNDHGIASLLQGAYDVAEQSFKEVARLRPDLPDGWRNQARRWIVSATPERAEPLLRKVDEVAPLDPQRPYFWGRYFERVEEYEAAEEAYEASLEVFPRDRDGWRRLGAVRYKLHAYEASLRAYLEVLAIDPEDLEAHKRRLDIYRQLGREAEAAEAKKAFEKYRRDDEAVEVARKFLLEHAEINHEAQARHVHR
ncbi:MAG: multiheme c-type cytochrome [Planctomycetota bacterium]|jgi:tetratricopeptide (TPR) repeat protein